MNRTNRIALMAALALFVAVSGTVLATRAPAQEQRSSGVQAEESETPEAREELHADALARAVERLAAREIEVGDVAAFGALAERYGLGGAARIHAWADQTGRTVDEIAALRDGDGTTAVGWGKLAKELGVHPGLGWIMGNGRGPAEQPPGHERKADD